MLWTVMGWSTEFFQQGRHKALSFTDMDHFVDAFMCGYFGSMDPNNLLRMAWIWQRGDVSRDTGGDLAAALARVTAKMLVMPITHEMFFPPSDCAREAALVIGFPLVTLAAPGLFPDTQISPHDLDPALCLALGNRPWKFSRNGEELRLQPQGRLRSNSGTFLAQSAVAGAGAIQVPSYYGSQDCAKRRLIQLFPD